MIFFGGWLKFSDELSISWYLPVIMSGEDDENDNKQLSSVFDPVFYGL